MYFSRDVPRLLMIVQIERRHTVVDESLGRVTNRCQFSTFLLSTLVILSSNLKQQVMISIDNKHYCAHLSAWSLQRD